MTRGVMDVGYNDGHAFIFFGGVPLLLLFNKSLRDGGEGG